MKHVRTIGMIFARLFIWIIPVNLFDGCLNRDPYLKIDDRYAISAICGSCPMGLWFHDRSFRLSTEDLRAELNHHSSDDILRRYRWGLEDISNYEVSNFAIIGNYPEGMFIADRNSGKLSLFASQDERDDALLNQYGPDSHHAFHPPSGWMWIRSRLLGTWFVAYYLACFVIIPVHTI